MAQTPASTHPPTVLIVEDNVDIRELLEMLIRGDVSPSQIHVASTLAEATAILAREPVDIMLIDPALPDSQGYKTIRTLMEAAPMVTAAVVTGFPTTADHAQALADGARGYYDKVDLIKDWHKTQLMKHLLADVRESDFS